MSERRRLSPRATKFVCLIIAAILSLTVFTPIFSSPKTHSKSIEILDNKKLNAMSMSAAVTAASVAISAIPDDVGSSVADELDDLSSILLIIVCVLYLEKYLLTIMSFIAFSGLLPGALVLFGVNLYADKENLKIWASRFLILAMVFSCLIPLSVLFTDMLDKAFAESANQAFDAVYRILEDNSSAEEDANFFERFYASIKDTITGVVDAAKKMLSLFVDAVAVLVVTSCLIPLLTIIAFVMIIKTIFRLPLNVMETFNSTRDLFRTHLPSKKLQSLLKTDSDTDDNVAS